MCGGGSDIHVGEGVVIPVVNVQCFAVHKALATPGSLWLLLIIKGLKLVAEMIRIHSVMIKLGSIIILKCFSMECEEFLVCLPSWNLKVLVDDQWLVVVVDGDQEEPSLTLSVAGEGVIPTGGVNIVTGLVTAHALAGRNLLVDGLTLGSGLEQEGCKINLKQ